MKSDWYRCDGRGNEKTSEAPSKPIPPSLHHSIPPSRRQVLLGTTLALVAWAAREKTALAQVTVTPDRNEPRGDVLVNIFLRGGADGLNIIVPYAEDNYHRRRPTLRVAAPNEKQVSPADRALDLDGFFGLHPTLAPLHPLYKEGLLACVHAVGSGDQTRSHFEAMTAMERGLASDESGTASGWLARHLNSTQSENTSPLRAVAFSSVMPDSLRGATDATAITSLADFRLSMADFGPSSDENPIQNPESRIQNRTEALRRTLADLYEDGQDAIARAGRETLAVLDTLNRIDPARYRPANGAAYPDTDLGNGLRQVACLMKGGVGLEVAFLDRGGWDTHFGQNVAGPLGLAPQLEDVGRSLAAFAADLGREMNRVTVVVMTEFGRRLQENSTLGTDHGRGSVMFLLGGGIAGGKVYAQWPGLEDNQLEGPGDLRVTTDYRDVLAEVLAKRLHNARLDSVFPHYTPRFPGVTSVDHARRPFVSAASAMKLS